ncbi:LPXTG cell wall anchor domain-containing protein [bacterium]|nr:LPXTG cell wall anchor domain-containing protein [bacterium]
MLKKFVNGAAAASLFVAGIASAQTTTSTTTPGVPNTGAGDIALNAVILGISAMIAVGGALYLYMQRNALAE